MTSPQRTARITGALYLGVAIFGAFAFLYVKALVRVPGDAAATAANVVAHADLVRFGFVADLLQATLFLFVVLGFHRLLAQVNQHVARAMVAFVAVAVAIMCLNAVFHYAALRLATDPGGYAGLGESQSRSLVLLLLDMNFDGFIVAQIFFGLWLAPLGYLAYRSGLFPRALGVALVIGCVGYLADTLAQFLVPGLSDAAGTVLTAPAGIAECWMVGYLLVRGVRRTPALA
ncbi:DUF4386 domain-containing protein [Catellatospora tritici]|uniref:DUF4386 domain-containing protein n=1 Tax=Catellatospora tritici TaxID=2851566 RepID=UPI001C2D1D71|nr:DUF4386 domain-containing protein [Catellatospora tritici]MBV1850715.1 DUF4386 domain-containing protein [Catellatospora tritici]MBV1850968.1 DUF4386 domain-containing protein [Catellatospora tritici]